MARSDDSCGHGLQDAEFVAFRVGHHNPGLISTLTDVAVDASETSRQLDGRGLIGGSKVEVQPVLSSRRFLVAGLQQQCRARAVGIVESNRIRRMIHSLVAEQRGPELGEFVRLS